MNDPDAALTQLFPLPPHPGVTNTPRPLYGGAPRRPAAPAETVILPRAQASPTAEKGPDTPAGPSGLTRWLAFAPLGAVLVAQSAIALRLRNTAFLDEATYLYAGHRLLAHLVYGAPNYDNYAAYFSGAPFLYPIAGAAADIVGGLSGARLLSLFFMVAATCFVHAAAANLFGRRTAFFSAALFALSGPVLFMTHFATFDAPAVLFLSAAFWAAVKTAHRRALVLETAVFAVAAVALKYAAMVFVAPLVPVIVAVAVPKVGWRWALARGAVLAATVTAFGATAAVLAGRDVVTGIVTTTTARPADHVSAHVIVARSAVYVGVIFAVAAVSTLAYAVRGTGNAAGGWFNRLVLGSVLSASALIATVGDIRLHTLTSLEKHAGYGLVFAAPMAGLLLSRFAGRSHFRLGLATVLALAVGASGARQAADFYAEWPNSTALVKAIAADATSPNEQILAEENSVPRYYLRRTIAQTSWSDTYYLDYRDAKGTRLVGEPAYAAALTEHHFTLVVFTFNATAALDRRLLPVLAGNGYREVGHIPYHSRFGPGVYRIWKLESNPR